LGTEGRDDVLAGCCGPDVVPTARLWPGYEFDVLGCFHITTVDSDQTCTVGSRSKDRKLKSVRVRGYHWIKRRSKRARSKGLCRNSHSTTYSPTDAQSVQPPSTRPTTQPRTFPRLLPAMRRLGKLQPETLTNSQAPAPLRNTNPHSTIPFNPSKTVDSPKPAPSPPPTASAAGSYNSAYPPSACSSTAPASTPARGTPVPCRRGRRRNSSRRTRRSSRSRGWWGRLSRMCC
jgi:hypothetical protein